MRWERLFTDLEDRFAQMEAAQDQQERAAAERLAQGEITLVQRLLGAVGARIAVVTRGGVELGGQLRQVGPDWLLLAEAVHREVLVPTVSVGRIDGLLNTTGLPLASVATRLDLRYALRGIARDRSPVTLLAGGSEVSGTVDRVGRDFIEVAVHAPWELRRSGQVRSVITVPLPAVDHLRAVAQG